VSSTISERQRKLVQDGAKGVAERWVGDSEEGTKSRAAFRSSVKRYSGKEAEQPERAPGPQQRTRKRSIRAEQAATGMMGPPPDTFDEKAIQDWLGKMSREDLQKLARLADMAKQGRENGRPAWNKVDHGLRQQPVHVQVYGGTVTVNTAAPSSHSPQRKYSQGPSNDWGRRLARLKDFING